MSLDGKAIDYVKPEEFDTIYDKLLHPCRSGTFNFRDWWIIVIGGASGVGKTRMSLELAKALAKALVNQQKEPLEVQYLSFALNDGGDAWDLGAERNQHALQRNEYRLVCLLMRVGLHIQELEADARLNLNHLLQTMFSSSQNTLKLLVFNIDECHRNFATAAEMLRVIREFNGLASNIKILPIITGIWFDIKQLPGDGDVSRLNFHQTMLHFLPKLKVPQLVASVLSSLSPNGMTLLEQREAKMLMEDTLGWARAVTTLAFTIAWLNNRLAGLNWQEVEQQYLASISSQYNGDHAKNLVEGNEYLARLILVALSPHPVSRGSIVEGRF